MTNSPFLIFAVSRTMLFGASSSSAFAQLALLIIGVAAIVVYGVFFS
jgi:uncharacterized membrane protein YuzA (DUF378 family)